MLKKSLGVLLFITVIFFGVSAFAYSDGWIATDRFGYEGTITQYSDEDLTNQVGDALIISDRDLALRSVSDYWGSPWSIVTSSWWYSTALDDDGNPRGLGWGNTHGNTGAGFIQYRDLSQDFVTEQSYYFSDFDGTYWTTFNFSSSVVNAPYYDADSNVAAYSRLSAPSNTGDAGIFHTLNVNLVATGLQGYLRSNGWIVASESDQLPTGVTGNISGLFENTSSNQGFYVFNFELNMDNWAYDNRDSLVGAYPFYNGSYGAPVLEPGTIALLGIGCRAGFLRLPPQEQSL